MPTSAKPLNGCMCQDGSCESCNLLTQAWEHMRRTLDLTLETLNNLTTEDYAKGADREVRDEIEASLALAAKVRP